MDRSVDSKKQLRPIAHWASRKLTASQLNYSVIEKELYAVVWSVQVFYQYVFATEVHLYSDNRPLQWLHTLTRDNQRLARWSLLLQNFSITSHFIKGTSNVVADCRLHVACY